MEKAFGTVEYSILLKHVFNAGINGKTWHILCNWYTETTCCVKVNNLLSTEFTIERGVKQGSILSPILFTLVIDPLLEKMASSGLGVSIAGLQLGTMAYADDIRTITNSVEAHQMCTSIIESYTQENGLKLNQEKCEVLLVPRSENSKPPQIICPIVSSVRILGSWFTSDLSSKTSIANNIKRAHSAFFANGKIGLLEGKPNPLTSREIIEHCVIPTLLYRSEHWTKVLSVPWSPVTQNWGKEF